MEQAKKAGFKVRSKVADRRQDTSPEARKVRALWLFLHELQVVRDSSEAALASYVKRIAHVEDMHWAGTRLSLLRIPPDQCSRVCAPSPIRFCEFEALRFHGYAKKLLCTSQALLNAALLYCRFNDLADSHGAMSLAEAIDCGAPPVNPPVACRALLFNIANSLAKRPTRTPADVYECTRYAWARLAKPAADIIAIGYSGNISRGAFITPRWHKENDGRLSFTADTTNWLDQAHHLLGHSFTTVLHLAPWRQGNGAIGVEFDGVGQFRIFRGASTTVAEQWYPCV